MKKLLSPKVIRQIRAMIANVLANPKEFNQNSFPDSVKSEHLPRLKKLVASGHTCDLKSAGCGTPFCAAGHLVFVRSKKDFVKLVSDPYTDWEKKARIELGDRFNSFLREQESMNKGSWTRIFGDNYGWPKRFTEMYNKADTYKTEAAKAKYRAKAFEARWEAFIASDGQDIKYGYYSDDNQNY